MEDLKKFLEENNINESELLKILQANKNKYKGMTIESVLKEFKKELEKEELSDNTQKDYMRVIKNFIEFGEIKEIKDITQAKHKAYNEHLKKEKKQKLSSTNRSVVIVNKFLYFVGCGDSTIKQDRVQRKTNADNVFTKKEFDRLLEYAMKTDKIKNAQKELKTATTKEERKIAQKKLNKAIREYRKKYDTIHIMIGIFGTGIRDNEIVYLTYEAVERGEMTITNKGKTRVVPIPQWVRKMLLEYCKNKGIKEGIIFYGRDKNNRLSHSQIWRNIQWLVGQARINKKKAHEHSLRKLMAKEYMMQTNNDRESLRDILGHESLETVAIYTQKTLKEQKEDMEKMKLDIKPKFI